MTQQLTERLMNRLIGAHVSASGGVEKSPKRASEIGGNVLQFFTSSPRTWAPADPSKFIDDAFERSASLNGIKANVIHAIYLINLASDKPEILEKSRKILLSDLKIAAKLKSVGVVVHLGSHQGRGYESIRDQVINDIKQLIEQTPDDAVLLIENSAGQKGKLSSDLAEIKDMLDEIKSPRVKWCFDTCHAHAAGYVLGNSKFENSASPADGRNSKPVLDVIEELGLLKSLAVIHVNDSRDAFDSGRDRHENLGEGEIDTQGFKDFLNDKRIQDIPLILEVPGFDKKGPDAKNIEILKSWVGE